MINIDLDWIEENFEEEPLKFKINDDNLNDRYSKQDFDMNWIENEEKIENNIQITENLKDLIEEAWYLYLQSFWFKEKEKTITKKYIEKITDYFYKFLDMSILIDINEIIENKVSLKEMEYMLWLYQRKFWFSTKATLFTPKMLSTLSNEELTSIVLIHYFSVYWVNEELLRNWVLEAYFPNWNFEEINYNEKTAKEIEKKIRDELDARMSVAKSIKIMKFEELAEEVINFFLYSSTSFNEQDLKLFEEILKKWWLSYVKEIEFSKIKQKNIKNKLLLEWYIDIDKLNMSEIENLLAELAWEPVPIYHNSKKAYNLSQKLNSIVDEKKKNILMKIEKRIKNIIFSKKDENNSYQKTEFFMYFWMHHKFWKPILINCFKFNKHPILNKNFVIKLYDYARNVLKNTKRDKIILINWDYRKNKEFLLKNINHILSILTEIISESKRKWRNVDELIDFLIELIKESKNISTQKLISAYNALNLRLDLKDENTKFIVIDKTWKLTKYTPSKELLESNKLQELINVIFNKLVENIDDRFLDEILKLKKRKVKQILKKINEKYWIELSLNRDFIIKLNQDIKWIKITSWFKNMTTNIPRYSTIDLNEFFRKLPYNESEIFVWWWTKWNKNVDVDLFLIERNNEWYVNARFWRDFNYKGEWFYFTWDMTSTRTVKYVYEDWTTETKQEWVELMYRKLDTSITNQKYIIIWEQLYSWSETETHDIFFVTNKINEWNTFKIWTILYDRKWELKRNWDYVLNYLFDLENKKLFILDFAWHIWSWEINSLSNFLSDESLSFYNLVWKSYLSIYKLMYNYFKNKWIIFITNDKTKNEIIENIKNKINNNGIDENDIKELVGEMIIEVNYSNIQKSIKNILSKL